MGISSKTIKLLWGRAAQRCSLPECRQELVVEGTKTDEESIVGEVAHIVAEEPKGPRGDSHLSPQDLNKYSNLILLCNVHHKLVDDQVNYFTVERLHQIKENHERWVKETLSKQTSSPDDFTMSDAAAGLLHVLLRNPGVPMLITTDLAGLIIQIGGRALCTPPDTTESLAWGQAIEELDKAKLIEAVGENEYLLVPSALGKSKGAAWSKTSKVSAEQLALIEKRQCGLRIDSLYVERDGYRSKGAFTLLVVPGWEEKIELSVISAEKVSSILSRVAWNKQPIEMKVNRAEFLDFAACASSSIVDIGRAWRFTEDGALGFAAEISSSSGNSIGRLLRHAVEFSECIEELYWPRARQLHIVGVLSMPNITLLLSFPSVDGSIVGRPNHSLVANKTVWNKEKDSKAIDVFPWDASVARLMIGLLRGMLCTTSGLTNSTEELVALYEEEYQVKL